jgi:hypothetical protein
LSNINKKSLLYTAIFLLGGCLNEQNMADEAKADKHNSATTPRTQTCNIPENAFNELPTEILDGTDVVDISNFKPADAPGNHFYKEIGGASLEIDTKPQNGIYTIQRIYREPGMENSIATYNNLCMNKSYLYGENIRGIFTENGILWLELESRHEFIPADLWIYLENN